MVAHAPCLFARLAQRPKLPKQIIHHVPQVSVIKPNDWPPLKVVHKAIVPKQGLRWEVATQQLEAGTRAFTKLDNARQKQKGRERRADERAEG